MRHWISSHAGGNCSGGGAQPAFKSAAAQFTADGKLVRPVDYRRWVYVSSGFGMSYNANAGGNGEPAFTNVFVNPASYDYFQANGKWPDKTMFVLEVYGSTSNGSINKHGSFQKTFMGLDVEVKDEARFPEKWAYFNFDSEEKPPAPRRRRKTNVGSATNRMPRWNTRLCSFIQKY